MRIAVVGDVLLDADVHGAAHRLSPDGPVPVVDVAEVAHRPGGAGLAALLLAASGCQTTLVTAMGDDEDADRLRSLLSDVQLAVGPSGAPTPVKRRVVANDQVIARLDENCGRGDPPQLTPQMISALRSSDGILVADYGRGLCALPELRTELTALAQRIPVVWDPHPRGADPVPGAAAVTPNLTEACATAGIGSPSRRHAATAAADLVGRWSARSVVVTLGTGGAAVVTDDGALPQFIPAPHQAHGDACGAGDRFAGSLTRQLALGTDIGPAVEHAVAAASAFIAGGGVSSLDPTTAGTDGAPRGGSCGGSSIPDVQQRTAAIRRAGGTVVATGGCFDLLHAGHARTLSAARSLGDFLIVCLNSDPSIRRLKGDGRPLMQEADRVELLEALECVDAVVVFGEDTPEEVLSELRPDLWVKGGDYVSETLPEAHLLRTWGGQAVTVPFHPARSTTQLAEALRIVS
ncbi:PfkB family carbohydrate kinase [Brevibacterium yomogidense]|uniref:PfkB family carbohydrate kinase n=1 Tax=Brevibacterium yomogidense TaxID=946573 RepID=UPI0018DF9C87|nr:PfkB family carbohydrate kinase [Brevibacterium yomogidense]